MNGRNSNQPDGYFMGFSGHFITFEETEISAVSCRQIEMIILFDLEKPGPPPPGAGSKIGRDFYLHRASYAARNVSME